MSLSQIDVFPLHGVELVYPQTQVREFDIILQ